MKTSTYARNVQLDRFGLLANGGFLRIYTAPQAGSPDDKIPNNAQLISEHRLAVPAFASAFAGTLKANKIEDDPDARLSATAAWCRLTQMDGSTVLFDGTVGEGENDLKMNPRIQAHARVTIEGMTINQPQ